MTPVRVRAAALPITVVFVALFALLSACSSGGADSGSLPTVGTPAPNSPPGTLPPVEDTQPPAATMPPPSGNASACDGAPFELSVRTGSGEDRTVPETSSWALQAPSSSSWLFVTSDLELPADSVRNALPDPAGKTLVIIRLTSTVATTQLIQLAAGDRFEPAGTTAAPNGKPVVDLQVRTAPGQPPSTGTLTGSLTVDAVTSEGVCLSVDLHRDAGAQAKGRIAAPFLGVNQSVLTS